MFLKQLRLYSLCILTIFGLGLTACETIDGAGRDIESAGESIQDAAN